MDRARENWQKMGRTEKWIQQRMTGQEMPLAFSNTNKINKYIHC
jgi:tRNA(Ile2) C34 agmatinyltransferase TiaS